jgi:hypothetical protein
MRDVAHYLTELRADHILILEAMNGRISKLECMMDLCSCPQGRGYFEKKGSPKNNPWAPSADRFPVPGRNGGKYESGNVRLVHRRCNQQDAGRMLAKWLDETVDGRKVRSEAGKKGARSLMNSGYHQTLKGQQHHSRAGKAGSHETKVLAGQLSVQARIKSGYYQTEKALAQLSAAGKLGRQKQPRKVRIQNGKRWAKVTNCKRWQRERGKPCICGSHMNS